MSLWQSPALRDACICQAEMTVVMHTRVQTLGVPCSPSGPRYRGLQSHHICKKRFKMNDPRIAKLLCDSSSFKFSNGVILVLKQASDESIFRMPIFDNLSTLMSSLLLLSEAKLHFMQWVKP